MGRIRFYECPACGEFKVLPVKKGAYRCQLCLKNWKTSDIDLDTYEDSSGDLTTDKPITGLDNDAEREFVELMQIQAIKDQILSCIPPATRSMYPEDETQAALEFYQKHRELFT